jgi:hypothetical protein
MRALKVLVAMNGAVAAHLPAMHVGIELVAGAYRCLLALQTIA